MNVTDFLLQVAIILFTTKLFGILMRKLGLPQVLGFIVAGILIGPSIWELFFDLDGVSVFPLKQNAYLNGFAEVGVIFVMFAAGLETNLQDVKKTGGTAFFGRGGWRFVAACLRHRDRRVVFAARRTRLFFLAVRRRYNDGDFGGYYRRSASRTRKTYD